MSSTPPPHPQRTCSKSKKPFVQPQENIVEHDQSHILKDIHSMTFHQLRTFSKNLGIPARGSKPELLSALNCFLVKEKEDFSGGGSLVTLEHVSAQMSSLGPDDIGSGKEFKSSSDGDCPQNSTVSVTEEHIFMEQKEIHERTQSKRQAKRSSVGRGGNSNRLSEELSFEQKKGRRKPLLFDDGNTHEVNSCNQVIQQKSSIVTNEVSDMKRSLAKRKKSSQMADEDGPSTTGTGVLENHSEPWTILTHKRPQPGWVPYNPRTMRPPPLSDYTKYMKLISWNVNGLRALLKVEDFSGMAQRENFDILCLQETKLQEKDVVKIKQNLVDGYENNFWTCSVSKLGYSGSAIISRIKPLSVRYGLGILDHDSEGRLVTVEFDTFYLISGYVPNSGDGLKRLDYRVTQWDPSLANYMKELEKSKPVILTGDLNCAHQEIDIFNPAGNKRSAGFTNEERESFEANFLSRGFVDTFRRQHPGVVGYTYWGYRHGGRIVNKGWRLDYFLVSESIANKVHDSYILPDISGSDHCPIGIILKL